ncbi:preprotein translocase subunit SecE [Candidatus Amesbacteria bacterium RIFCSPLOWO2_02_FULL_48_11]|uniref:Protein translocase subunit SecE n=4 Tax=Candidatus Amesiibacteriota TaxID=1752730 RepID=A0A1F4Z6J2_9BACT|nr:MAG: Preprotein translocase, SecE subunit [Candidatus Amesbacteria bacterium GW2011_GWA2_47_11]KKU99144.1 MAG: Preprotein translocase, SecE subunit [Candidatus Amesbacteria bacterium GW2011_GWA1_48_9]OGC89117.1 MAG: preprotein translocase subunit SecE [Candidatus Amesbacteria bacterium RBG_19FT_COMBO_48_16]OGC98619.1 MAG: preprotein translocase subunit SecE [Candidatus Amesbacteria bacterium RBG_16_48_31]OGD01182.1 MAG: preprotein translocase subunit SecE [Candidatus Amesbacteria bacterium R
MNLVSYIKDTVSELKAVTWPTREQTIQLTIIVIAISAVVAAYVGALDFVFTNLLTILLK